MEFIEPLEEPPLWQDTGSPFGSVSSLVPNSRTFESFTRLFHPISGSATGGPIRWRDVARSRSLMWHPEVQFGSIAEADSPHRPLLGNLGQEAIRQIMDHVVDESGVDPMCVAALSDTETWASSMSDEPHNAGRFGVSSASLEKAGRLEGPPPLRRSYKCFNIQASEVAQFGVNVPHRMFVQMQPTLIIAHDGSFCLATDPDYDSTILAGSKALQEAVLGDDGVESLPIDPDASLLIDADSINRQHG